MEALEALDRISDATRGIAAYMVEHRPGDYGYILPDTFDRAPWLRGCRVWALHDSPQPGCSPDVVVYAGRRWVEAWRTYNHHLIDSDAIALYQGKKIHEPIF